MEEEGEYRVGLRLRHADYAAREARVDVYALPARRRVDADDGVDSLDLLSANMKACGARSLCLSDGAMDGGQALKVLLQTGAEG